MPNGMTSYDCRASTPPSNEDAADAAARYLENGLPSRRHRNRADQLEVMGCVDLAPIRDNADQWFFNTHRSNSVRLCCSLTRDASRLRRVR